MLVLTRKVGQEIHIGRGVTIKLLTMRDGKVQIGITAPGEVKILRGELGKPIVAGNVTAQAGDEVAA